MPSPFKVLELLNGEELAELETFAREPGRTVVECHEWLQAHGFTLSHGAVGNWLKEFKAQLQVQKFSNSAEMAKALTSAVGAGDFEGIAAATSLQLAQVAFEWASQADGTVSDPLDIMRITPALNNTIGGKIGLTKMLAEKFDREMAAKAEARPDRKITAEDIAAAREAIFGR